MKGRPVKDGDGGVLAALPCSLRPSMKGRPVKDGDKGWRQTSNGFVVPQ